MATARSSAEQRADLFPRTAHRHESWSVAQVARYLNETVGPKLTAYTVGKSAQTVGRWASGAQTPPQPEVESRLRAVFQIVQLLTEVDSRHVARAWLIGMNPQLEDRSPAEVIADGDVRSVMAAARAFASGG